MAEWVDPKEMDILYRELAADAAASGSRLNPDKEALRECPICRAREERFEKFPQFP